MNKNMHSQKMLLIKLLMGNFKHCKKGTSENFFFPSNQENYLNWLIWRKSENILTEMLPRQREIRWPIQKSIAWISFQYDSAVTGVMHEADDAYSIWSTWSCYWLDQFLTLALDAWILSKFSTLYWICLLLVFLILVGVELPLCL